MNNTFLYISLISLLSFGNIGYSQSNCNPLDPDLCSNSAPFINDDFEIEEYWKSDIPVELYKMPVISYINNDCIPTIFSSSNSNSGTTINLIKGSDGSLLDQFQINVNPLFSLSASAISQRNIVTANSKFGNPSIYREKLISYDFNGNELWISNEKYSFDNLIDVSGTPAFADFNQDGTAEVYINNKIYNSENGILLASGENNGLGSSLGTSVAGYLDDDPSTLELAAGYSIYQFDIQNISGQINNSYVANNIEIEGEFRDGLTTISDINDDGITDVIVASIINDDDLLLYSYFLNENETELIAKVNISTSDGLRGLPIIADIDNDGVPSIIISTPFLLSSFRFDGTSEFLLEWTLETTDESGGCGITVFDLNNDGVNEIIYRDATHLKIINIVNGTPIVLNALNCSAPTAFEIPVIVNLDNSGQAKICISCVDDNGDNRLTVFGAPPDADPWAPARGIWNQYNYHVLNINDDGTVPQYQENNATYQNGRYNNFMVQASLLDEDGNQQVPAAQLMGDISCVDYDAETDTYSVTFDLHNLDDASLTAVAGMNVSFYDGDPTVDGILLGTYETIQPIGNDESLLGLQISFSAADLTQLYMAVNTSGASPLDNESYDILECDYADNVVQAVSFPVITQEMATVCDGSIYNFYGTSLSVPNIYYHFIDNAQGCDSVLIELILVEDCDVECEVIDTSLCYVTKPLVNEEFTLELKSIINDSVMSHGMLLIDVNNDCIPELISSNFDLENMGHNHISGIKIIDTVTGDVLSTISTPKYLLRQQTQFCVADVDGNGTIELIVASSRYNVDSLDNRLFCYNIDGTLKWKSEPFTFGGTPQLADFNQDGIPEVYISNIIYNAVTGEKLIEGGPYGRGVGLTFNDRFSLTVAAQIDPSSNNLELAAGYTVYEVNIINTSGQSGNSMTPHSIERFGKFKDGYTSIGDVNKDGLLDVIVAANGKDEGIELYIYNLNNGNIEYIANYEFIPDDSSEIHWTVPLVTDLLGGGDVTILTQAWGTMYILRYDGTESLEVLLEEEEDYEYHSETKSVYDFNNDGVKEILLSGYNEIKIVNFNGQSFDVLDSIYCENRIFNSIVGNVKNNSESNLCITCEAGCEPLPNSGCRAYYNIHIYGGEEDTPWIPARSIWNQHGYHVLNINDDGTVPQYQENNATYQNGRYNNFMVQASLLDEDGNQQVPAAQLTGDISCVDYDVETDTYTITFDLHNLEDASLDAATGMYVSFYDGDPTVDGTLLDIYQTTQPIQKNTSLTGLTISITAAQLTQLYMVVNTDGITPGPLLDEDYDILECDYADNISQASVLPTISQLTGSVCNGSSYDFYGESLTTSGTYYHTEENILGCDSLVVELHLAMSDTIIKEQEIITCQSYLWNGVEYFESGIYNDTTTTNDGCDSTTILNLTINEAISVTESISTCEEYQWNGNVYTESGIYYFDTLSLAGCDSTVILQLTLDTTSMVMIDSISCDSILWHGTVYTESGSYTHESLSSTGCDSITILNLMINESISVTESISTCDEYQWNGNVYTESGIYNFDTLSLAGCDSTVTLQLTLDTTSMVMIDSISCDSILWHGTVYTESGSYSYETVSNTGCDSTTMLNLTITQSDTVNLSLSVCDSYMWNDSTYIESGVYYFDSIGISGCDSTTILDLTISTSYEETDTIVACDSLQWNGETFYESGVYTIDTFNIDGCDSIISLDLIIESQESTTIYIDTCGPYFWELSGDTYIDTGIYQDTLYTTDGCDSFIILDLSVSNPYIHTDTVYSSLPYEWMINGELYFETGIYQETYTSTNYCDSIHVLDLTIDLAKVNDIVIPNIFSPNDDGANDTWYIDLSDYKDVEAYIYDRWGNLVYHSDNSLIPTWNGTFKGSKAVQGVYVFLINYTDDTDNKHQLVGDLTLIR